MSKNILYGTEGEVIMQEIIIACRDFNEEIESYNCNINLQFEYCLEAITIIEMINHLAGFEIEKVDDNNDKVTLIRNTFSLVSQIETYATEYIMKHGSEEGKEKIVRDNKKQKINLTDENLDKAQKLINELRRIILNSEELDGEHRLRLLKRLEIMQLELYKTKSNPDRFILFFNEVGVALGKFGEDIKPLVDRARELANIFNKINPQGKIEAPSDNHLSNGDIEE